MEEDASRVEEDMSYDPYQLEDIAPAVEDVPPDEEKVEQEEKEEDDGGVDEPVYITVGRSLLIMMLKMVLVMLPLPVLSGKQKRLLLDWDLYGPSFFCLLFSTLVGMSAHTDKLMVFACLFIFFWMGVLVVAFNSVLVGANISVFPIVSLLGYALFPLVIGSAVMLYDSIYLRLFIAVFCGLWSVFAAASFICQFIPAIHLPGRIIQAVYPIALFYAMLAWIAFVVRLDTNGAGLEKLG